jgi:hypothetical protein
MVGGVFLMSDVKGKKQENPLNSLLYNVLIPVVILTVFSKEKFLGPVWGLVAALVLPIGYGARTLMREKRADGIAILGIVSVMLTGVFGLFELDAKWIAIKEAAIPLVIGIAVVATLKTKNPLIKKILMTEALFDVKRLKRTLSERGTEPEFERRLVGLTWVFASAFFLSSVLNYLLAVLVLKSEPGTEAYTAEIGKMTLYGYFVVMIPSMAIMIWVLHRLMNTLTELTGLKFNDILAEAHREKEPNEPVEEEPVV